MSVDDICSKRYGSEDSVQTDLNRIKNDYESIFSWNIKEKTSTNINRMLKVIDKTRKKFDIVMESKDAFSLNR